MPPAAQQMHIFIEGLLIHGKQEPQILLITATHGPHRGMLMPIQLLWTAGSLPSNLLQTQLEGTWGIPCRFHDESTLPVVFDERTSRLPTPWIMRLEGWEGQQRLFITHLLRTRSREPNPPMAPEGSLWADAHSISHPNIPNGIRRLCLSALQIVRDARE